MQANTQVLQESEGWRSFSSQIGNVTIIEKAQGYVRFGSAATAAWYLATNSRRSFSAFWVSQTGSYLRHCSTADLTLSSKATHGLHSCRCFSISRHRTSFTRPSM